MVGVGTPSAAAMNWTLSPESALTSSGCVVTLGVEVRSSVQPSIEPTMP